jgi:hypothetical protein
MQSLMHQNILNLALMQPAKNIDDSVASVKNPMNRGKLEYEPQRPSQCPSHTVPSRVPSNRVATLHSSLEQSLTATVIFFARGSARLRAHTFILSLLLSQKRIMNPQSIAELTKNNLHTRAFSRPDRNILYSDATSSNAYTDRKTWAIHGIHNQTGRDGNQRHGNFDALSCISSRILQPQARRQRR